MSDLADEHLYDVPAPMGTIYVCQACGKTSPTQSGKAHRGVKASDGWDSSCFLWAELCDLPGPPWRKSTKKLSGTLFGVPMYVDSSISTSGAKFTMETSSALARKRPLINDAQPCAECKRQCESGGCPVQHYCNVCHPAPANYVKIVTDA